MELRVPQGLLETQEIRERLATPVILEQVVSEGLVVLPALEEQQEMQVIKELRGTLVTLARSVRPVQVEPLATVEQPVIRAIEAQQVEPVTQETTVSQVRAV